MLLVVQVDLLPLDGLIRLDKSWEILRNGGWKVTPEKVVYNIKNTKVIDNNEYIYDVLICGGTLGIFYAVALQNLGYNVAVIERNKIKGRDQEWNISRKELVALLRTKILKEEEINQIIGIEFNPVRVGFKSDTSATSKSKGFETYVTDILNLGIKPNKLIEIVKEKFIEAGGTIIEDVLLNKVNIFENIAEIEISSSLPTTQQKQTETTKIHAKLIIDAMGNGSPIVKQIRGCVEPDGICIVVGGCASGFDPKNNTYSDLIYTDTPITSKSQSQLQYFWEAFPAGSGSQDRTTYLFTYMDAKPQRPSISEIIDDYWVLLPRYQGISIDNLQFKRVLYGLFPTYRNSPIKSSFNRVLQVGDASGIQSPLSFGGLYFLKKY
jgi:2-polyprenyl-6-methoxyphenol hydroxylase-like FAD-dependent oxidoreductase